MALAGRTPAAAVEEGAGCCRPDWAEEEQEEGEGGRTPREEGRDGSG